MAMIKKDIGAYSAYAIAVKHGYEGTEAEWVAAQEQARVDSEAAAKAAQAAQAAAEAARKQAQTAKTGAENAQAAAGQAAQTATGAARTATQAAQAAKTAKEAAEQAQTGAQNAKTGAVEAQGKAEEAAQGVAADREQIGANKSGLEAAQQELTATKEQLAETKASLTTTQEDLKKAQRAIQFQAELNRGQTWDFETDDSVAYSRTVPSGAKAGAVMEWGGKTVVWNQLASIKTAASTEQNFLNVKIPTSAFRLTHKYYFGDTATESDGTAFTFTTVGFWNATMDKYLRVETTGIRKNGKSAIVASWSSLPEGVTADDLTNIVFQYIGENSAEDSRVSAQDLTVIDLTLLYGPGHEPTDTTDPRIAQIEAYAAAHPECNAGELLSALVDDVRVRGRNIFSTDTMIVSDNGVYLGTKPLKQSASMAIKVKDGRAVPKVAFGFIRKDHKGATTATWLTFDTGELLAKSAIENYNPEQYASQYIGCYPGTREAIEQLADAFDIMVVPGEIAESNMPAYSPYSLTTLPIPDVVKQLPGYGWSAGSVANTIERTDTGWQFVQRVGKAEVSAKKQMNNQTGNYDNETSFMIAIYGALPKISAYKKNVRSLSCNTFTCPQVNVQDSQTERIYALSSHTQVQYSDILYFRFPYSIKTGLSKDSTAEVKENAAREWFGAHKTIIYYEQEPVITDITAPMGDALSPFAVEAGGSITLHHPKADEGFAIDVPAKIQYITKLSEVSANG